MSCVRYNLFVSSAQVADEYISVHFHCMQNQNKYFKIRVHAKVSAFKFLSLSCRWGNVSCDHLQKPHVTSSIQPHIRKANCYADGTQVDSDLSQVVKMSQHCTENRCSYKHAVSSWKVPLSPFGYDPVWVYCLRSTFWPEICVTSTNLKICSVFTHFTAVWEEKNVFHLWATLMTKLKRRRRKKALRCISQMQFFRHIMRERS